MLKACLSQYFFLSIMHDVWISPLKENIKMQGEIEVKATQNSLIKRREKKRKEAKRN
jgi:hypothetical protein